MIPGTNTILTAGVVTAAPASKTYRMHMEQEYIGGNCDGQEAVKQAVFKMLNTERYRYPVYSWNYGLETNDLIGQRMSYVQAELKRRITEALVQDDRILAVTNFEFDTGKRHEAVCTFVVHTAFGAFDSEKVVKI